MQKERNEIDKKYQWSVDKMYTSKEQWEEDFKQVDILSDQFTKLNGEFTKSGDSLLEAFKELEAIQRKMQNLQS